MIQVVVTYDIPDAYDEYLAKLLRNGDQGGIVEICENVAVGYSVEVA